MKKSRFFLCVLSLFVVSIAAYGKTTFSMPELDNESGILFSATHKHPGEISYSTLFFSDLDKEDSAKQLTTFPEQLSILSSGKILRIRNRYGVSQYSVENQSLSHTSSVLKEYIPSNPVLHGAESVSPDGKWICSLEKTGTATAKLMLKNASGYTETILVPSTELSYTSIPVRWAPDSSLLIYEKEGNIYFTEPDAMFQSNQIPETFRKIGRGSINCVQWASAKNLVYISGDLVYRIPLNEMYTRALYSDFVGTGTIIGRLPFPFNSSDSYNVNSECSRMVHIRGNRTVSYMQLPGNADFTIQLYAKTETVSAAQTLDFAVLWANSKRPILWSQRQRGTHTESTAIQIVEKNGTCTTENLDLPKGASLPSISPDGRRVFFTDTNKAYIYNIPTWEQIAQNECGTLASHVWIDSSSLYLGGTETLQKWSVTGNKQVLFPSSAKEYAWNMDSGCPTVKADGLLYEYDIKNSVWTKSTLLELPSSHSRNEKYRAFLGSSPNSDFTNAPYIRSLTGPAVTRVMYTPASKQKNERPKVALVFDALDNADGLANILKTLAKYNITATFFINGEFLRRYPAESIRIAQAGHECGSMFYTVADLTAVNNFVVDENFVRRGLARNEDEFFDRTGHELALVWHPPFYRTNKQIIRAGNLAGYNHVERINFPNDTITLEQAALSGKKYYSATQLIEIATSRLKNGGVIPVSIGCANGTRNDYLYDKLDLLIGSILDNGYEIVTAGTLLPPGQVVADTYPQE